MYLDEIVAAQKRGEARGIFSACSAHPYVIRQTLKVCETFEVPSLIEATCNQVNQFGGYTGRTPADFVGYVSRIAEENNTPFENIILGGDHLGPSVWQDEPAQVAMAKAEALIREYVEAGFVKIHLDCSMRLTDDPKGALDVEVSAKRAARLARMAEEIGGENLRYVIGTEVPIPGGAIDHETGVRVTRVEDARQTIEIMHEAFYRAGLQSAWERVIAVVVQPGVEFGDDFVWPYQPGAAKELSHFIQTQPLVYEAHSTDYQTPQALRQLVEDHFAILKVGPALTFAFREAVFALEMIEQELMTGRALEERSNLQAILEEQMLAHPEHWVSHYHGGPEVQRLARRFSLSDRIRYYWPRPPVQAALGRLLENLGQREIPLSLISQFLPEQSRRIQMEGISREPKVLIRDKIGEVLRGYRYACSTVS